MCFIECTNYLTEKEYTEDFGDFIRTERRRTNVMTYARNQPLCRKISVNNGCFHGTRMNPRNITRKNLAIKIHNNHFYLY